MFQSGSPYLWWFRRSKFPERFLHDRSQDWTYSRLHFELFRSDVRLMVVLVISYATMTNKGHFGLAHFSLIHRATPNSALFPANSNNYLSFGTCFPTQSLFFVPYRLETHATGWTISWTLISYNILSKHITEEWSQHVQMTLYLDTLSNPRNHTFLIHLIASSS